MNESSKTDWDRIGVMGDEAIDTSDIPPLSRAFFEKATLRARRPVAVTVHVDPDVLAWFQAQGQDYEQRLNAAFASTPRPISRSKPQRLSRRCTEIGKANVLLIPNPCRPP